MAKVMKQTRMYYPKPGEKRTGTSYDEGKSYVQYDENLADMLAPDENAFAGKLKMRRKAIEKGNPDPDMFRKIKNKK